MKLILVILSGVNLLALMMLITPAIIHSAFLSHQTEFKQMVFSGSIVAAPVLCLIGAALPLMLPTRSRMRLPIAVFPLLLAGTIIIL